MQCSFEPRKASYDLCSSSKLSEYCLVNFSLFSDSNGPIFGSGADLCISSDCNKNKDSYSQLPYSYGDTSLPQHLLTGTHTLHLHCLIPKPSCSIALDGLGMRLLTLLVPFPNWYSTEGLGMRLLTLLVPFPNWYSTEGLGMRLLTLLVPFPGSCHLQNTSVYLWDVTHGLRTKW